MTARQASRTRTWVIQLALACLLVTQSLGFLHRAAHTPGGGGKLAGVSALQSGTGATGLFAGHARDSTDCRLFDQLAHADLASLPLLAVPCDFSTAPARAALPCGHQPDPERSYCARGPPASA